MLLELCCRFQQMIQCNDSRCIDIQVSTPVMHTCMEKPFNKIANKYHSYWGKKLQLYKTDPLFIHSILKIP